MLARHIVDRCTAEPVMGFRDGTDYNVSSYVSPTMMFYNRKKTRSAGYAPWWFLRSLSCLPGKHSIRNTLLGRGSLRGECQR